MSDAYVLSLRRVDDDRASGTVMERLTLMARDRLDATREAREVVMMRQAHGHIVLDWRIDEIATGLFLDSTAAAQGAREE